MAMPTGIPSTSWQDLASIEEQLTTSRKRPDLNLVRKYLKGVRTCRYILVMRSVYISYASTYTTGDCHSHPVQSGRRTGHAAFNAYRPALTFLAFSRPQVRDNSLRRSELVAQLGKDWIQRGSFASQDESAPPAHASSPLPLVASPLRPPSLAAARASPPGAQLFQPLHRRPVSPPLSTNRVASPRAGRRRLLRRRRRRRRGGPRPRPRAALPGQRPRRRALLPNPLP